MKLHEDESGLFWWLDAPKDSPLYYAKFNTEEFARKAKALCDGNPQTIIGHCHRIRELIAHESFPFFSITSTDCLEQTYRIALHQSGRVKRWRYALIESLLGIHHNKALRVLSDKWERVNEYFDDRKRQRDKRQRAKQSGQAQRNNTQVRKRQP